MDRFPHLHHAVLEPEIRSKVASMRFFPTLSLLPIVALSLVLVSCADIGDGVPPQLVDVNPRPTWNGEIGALITARCGRCHTSPPLNQAPAGFRLDKYSASDGTDGLIGAFEQAQRIRTRAVLQRTMPPGDPLPVDEQNIIDKWVLAGAPRD